MKSKTGMPALAGIVAMMLSMTAAQAQIMPKEVVCTISASAMSGQRFVTLKCADKRQPGDYVIRDIVWERDDSKGYAEYVRLAGRRFSCDVNGTGGFTMSGDSRTTHLRLTNCH